MKLLLLILISNLCLADSLLYSGGGGGITTLNTLTGATQTFATPGTSGTAPAWTSSGTAHTLNLPMAATSSVTAGLISKTQYDVFNAKVSTESDPLALHINGDNAMAGNITFGSSDAYDIGTTGTRGRRVYVTKKFDVSSTSPDGIYATDSDDDLTAFMSPNGAHAYKTQVGISVGSGAGYVQASLYMNDDSYASLGFYSQAFGAEPNWVWTRTGTVTNYILATDATGSLGDGSHDPDKVHAKSQIHSRGAIVTDSSSTALTADDQAVVTTSKTFIKLTSDNATPTNRTFTLGNGTSGQHLILLWDDATNGGELQDTGNQKLSAAWAPAGNRYYTISLIYDGTNWVETARSNN